MKPKMNSRFLYLPFNQVELSWPKMTVSWQFTTHYMGCAKKRPQNGRTKPTTYENNPLCCLDIYSLFAVLESTCLKVVDPKQQGFTAYHCCTIFSHTFVCQKLKSQFAKAEKGNLENKYSLLYCTSM